MLCLPPFFTSLRKIAWLPKLPLQETRKPVARTLMAGNLGTGHLYDDVYGYRGYVGVMYAHGWIFHTDILGIRYNNRESTSKGPNCNYIVTRSC